MAGSGTIIGRAIIEIGADGTEFRRELPAETEPAAKASGLNIVGVLGKTVGAGAAAVGAGMAGLLGTALAKGFSRLTTIDDAQAKLKGLGYTTQQVSTIMNSAMSSVKGTAFSMGEAVTASATLVASGVKPGADLTRTLKLLADTSTIAGVGMGDLADNFSDVVISGKLTGESLSSLQDAGIPVVAFLSKSLGRSMKQVSQDVSDGKVSFEQFQTAMEKGLGGAALASGNTFSGAMDNIGAALGRLGANLLGGGFASLPALMGSFTKTLDSLGPISKTVGASLGEGFAKLVPVFKELMAGFGSFVGALVSNSQQITATGLAGYFQQVGVWVRALINLFIDYLIPAMGQVVSAGGALLGFLEQHRNLSIGLASAIGALLLVTQAHAAVLAYQSSAGLVAYITQLGIVQTATKIWAAVQWALNIAMEANPIGLIIVGLVALGAGLVLAYQNSETFRDIVNAAWAAIQSAVMTVVNWITGTAVPWIINAWNTISSGAQSLWGSIQSVWNSIMGALQAVINWIVGTFGPTFMTLEKTVEFAFKAMEILILAWWKLVVVPTFNAAQLALQQLGAVFSWLYSNAVKPAFDFISAVIQVNWAAIKIVFGLMQSGLTVLGGAASDFYSTMIKPAFDLVGAVIKNVWNNLVSPTFDAFKAGLGLLGKAFDVTVQAIKMAWDKIQDIVKAPIKFVIQTVLNGGLIKGFNWLGEKVGGPHIDDIPLPFALGGVLPGYSPGKDIHQFWSPTAGALALSGGEAIMRPEFTRAMGGPHAIDILNAQARAGKLSGPGNFANGGVIGGLASHHYDLGGVVDWIKSQSADALSWVGDKTSAIWKALSDPLSYLKGMMPSVPGAGVVPQYANAAGQKLLTSVVAKVTSLFGDFNKAYDSVGGPVFAKIKTWVMDHLGIPYLWGGNGPQFDCSSFTQHALAAAGISIPRTSEAQQAALRAVSAIKPGDLGFIGNPAHHVELFMGNGQWAEAPHTGDVTKVISQGMGDFTSFGAAFSRGGVFRPLLFDKGGVLPKGLSMVQNNTGAPEPLYPGGGGTNITVVVSIDDLAKLHTLDDFLAMLGNARTTARKTQRSGRVRA